MKIYKRVLCVVDQGESSERALSRAVALAESNQAKLSVVDVSPPFPDRPEAQGDSGLMQDLQMAMAGERKERLASLIQPYSQQLNIETKLLCGSTYLEVIREVLRNKHDLVVKCPVSHSWLDRLLSSNDISLLRECPCPVWLVKPEASGAMRSVLAALDVDDIYPPHELATRNALNVRIMELSISLALSESAELHVVHAWEAIGENSLRHSVFLRMAEIEVDAYVGRIRERHAELLNAFLRGFDREAMNRANLRMHMPKGAASEEIPALAKRLMVDCIVMGTVARTGISGFIMGNTAEGVLDQVDCSVLAIKPPGFETPVVLES
jgi:universal stress protein E